MNKDILICGVGGQGTILTSKILAAGLTELGYDVKMAEIHGMSPRGGFPGSGGRGDSSGEDAESGSGGHHGKGGFPGGGFPGQRGDTSDASDTGETATQTQ